MPKLEGNHVQVLVDGYDITGDSNHISINDSRDVFDVTGFGDEAHRFAPGQRMMSVQHAGFMNSGEARSHPALKGADVDGLFSVYVGENAEPQAGDPVFSMLTRQGRYGTLPEANQTIPFRAIFANRGDDGGWGVALASPTNIVGTFSGSAIDNGDASRGGGLACLHVLEAADNDVYTFSIQSSGSGAFAGEERTLATFTLDGRAVGSEQVKIDGRVPRHIRWVATADPAAQDRVRIAVSLIRTYDPVVFPAAVTPSPQGLLADFQFTARIPSGNPETAVVILEGYNRRTGVHWLFLTKQDGAKTDIDLAGLAWDSADDAPTSNSFGRGRPTFFGVGDHDWQLLPALLSNSSFYIYLPRDKQIYEFAVTANNEAANNFLSFATTPRPAGVVTGSPVRVLVADSGQASLIKKWIGAGNRPEVIAPPAKPRSPGLASDDGQATVTISPPDSGGAPISSYELNYRAVGSKAYPNFMGNLGDEPITVTGLTNGKPYEFRALAVNRGGRGPWSAFASIIPAPAPGGLLAYFQFVARVPATWNRDHALIILEGTHDRTGVAMLQLTKADGAGSDISLEGIAWEAASDTHSSNLFGQGRPTFFGEGEDEWQLLPTLLPNSSFYVCLLSDSEIWEFPITANNEAANHFLSFSTTPRPDSIQNGSMVSVVVADNGQANQVKDWIAAGNQPEVIAPPAKPQPPTLVSDDGQVTVTITPPAQGGSPISSYKVGYREAGSVADIAVFNIYSLSHTVTPLTNGASYEFRVLAVNRGGRGAWSDYANVMLPSPPQGLLTDFEFTSLDPSGNRLLGGSSPITGGRWLNLTKSNGKKTDIEVQTMDWRTGSQLEFGGTFLQDWQNIPSVLSNDSFYIYLPSDNQIYEFPVSSNNRSDGDSLRFGLTARPASIVAGSSIRVLVADSGQAQGIKDWIEEGYQPEVIEPPAKPSAPTLTIRRGQITATITPPAQGGSPITTYDFDVRTATGNGVFHIPLTESLSYTLTSVYSGEYKFRVAAINRGGRGPWSDYTFATAQS